MLGFLSARQALRLGRDSFFPTSNLDLPLRNSEQIKCDDLIPQFGYVGQRYAKRRILLMFVNPANGSDPRAADDERMMPHLTRFSKEPTERNFADAGQAYNAECHNWRMSSRYHSYLFGEEKLSCDEVAYANCLPWRTQSGTHFSDDIAKVTSKFYVGLLLDELKPKILIAMSKRSNEIINMSLIGMAEDKPIWRSFVWNFAQAETGQVRREREAMAAAILNTA